MDLYSRAPLSPIVFSPFGARIEITVGYLYPGAVVIGPAPASLLHGSGAAVILPVPVRAAAHGLQLVVVHLLQAVRRAVGFDFPPRLIDFFFRRFGAEDGPHFFNILGADQLSAQFLFVFPFAHVNRSFFMLTGFLRR